MDERETGGRGLPHDDHGDAGGLEAVERLLGHVRTGAIVVVVLGALLVAGGVLGGVAVAVSSATA